MTTVTLAPRATLPRVVVRASRPVGRPSAVRLTTRGRALVVVVALLAAFVVGVFVAAAGSVATERAGTPAPTRIVQIHEGDTLWAIASRLADGADVRTTMATIEQLNAMTSSTVRVGQRLVVPAR